LGNNKKGKFWRKPGYIGFRSANAYHRVDLKEGTKPMTIFIPGPFGLRKGPRSEYGIDFKTKKRLMTKQVLKKNLLIIVILKI
jgi:predicted transcriptional regulator of viral defense system